MSDEDNSPRSTVPINLTSKARLMVKHFKANTGVNQQLAVAKVLEWFAEQDKDFHAAVINGLGDPIDILARQRIKELQGDPAAPFSFEQTANAAIEMIRSMAAVGRGMEKQAKGAGEPAAQQAKDKKKG